VDPVTGALTLGLAYAPLALGIFVTMRVFNIPDITADASLTAGGAVTAALLVAGFDPWLATLLATIAGVVAGMLTGLIHTRLRIQALLAGILVMTAFYSLNLRVMGGRSNVPLAQFDTVFTPLQALLPGVDDSTRTLLLLLLITALFVAALSWLFRTDAGLAMRATGDNETMAPALGINPDAMKLLGIALANGVIAVSGSLVAQYQGYADIGMGIGIVLFGLASVMIGDTFASALGQERSMPVRLAAVVLGSVLFRGVVALVLWLGLPPGDMKLMTSLFVLAAILLPGTRKLLPRWKRA